MSDNENESALRPDLCAKRSAWTVVTERVRGAFSRHSVHGTRTAAQTAADSIAVTNRARVYLYDPSRVQVWTGGGTPPPAPRAAPTSSAPEAPARPKLDAAVNLKVDALTLHALDQVAARADLWGGYRADRSTVIRRAISVYLAEVSPNSQAEDSRSRPTLEAPTQGHEEAPPEETSTASAASSPRSPGQGARPQRAQHGTPRTSTKASDRAAHTPPSRRAKKS